MKKMKHNWRHPTLSELGGLNKNEVADEFSHGNANLKQLLLLLWDKGVETYSSNAENDIFGSCPSLSIYLGNHQPSLNFLQQFITNARNELKSEVLVNLGSNPSLALAYLGKNADKFFENLLKTAKKYSPADEQMPQSEFLSRLYKIVIDTCGWEAIYHLMFNGKNVFVYENGKRRLVLTYDQTLAKFPDHADWLKEHMKKAGDRCIVKPSRKK